MQHVGMADNTSEQDHHKTYKRFFKHPKFGTPPIQIQQDSNSPIYKSSNATEIPTQKILFALVTEYWLRLTQ
jgi:hypothetical protein